MFSDGPSLCSSSEITITQQQKSIDLGYVIIFAGYNAAAEITIRCTGYRNPTYAKTVGPFQMKVMDNEAIQNLIAVYPDWSFVIPAGKLKSVELAAPLTFSFYL